MKCKYHPDKPASHVCERCRIPLCSDCAEESEQGEYFCFQCAMISSVSAVGTSIKDRRVKATKDKVKIKKKFGPFQYFLIVSGVFILAMWGFILFGGEEAPAGTVDFSKNKRVFLFLVDGALKRYAYYEGNKYPEKLRDLVPKYLALPENQVPQLMGLSYQTDPEFGYRLSLSKPDPGEMIIIITPKGIQHQPPAGEGA